MATTTPNFGWPVPTSTDLVKDGAVAIEALGDAIDATVFGLGISPDTILSSGTFTSVSAVNLSSVLSDTYSFYTLDLYAAATSTVTLQLRVRQDTTDLATGYVAQGLSVNSGAAVASYNSGGSQTSVTLAGVGTSNTAVKVNITRSSATDPLITWHAESPAINASITGAARNPNATNFNGLSIYPSSTTITGYYILTGRKV